MRTRDEVLAELRQRFGTDDYCQSDVNGIDLYGMADHIVATERQRDEYHAMWTKETLAKRELADRLRELESPQASSEPVAWALMYPSLYDGSQMIELYQTRKEAEDMGDERTSLVPLYPHPSAATVTEAMVEAAAKVGCDNGFDRDFDAPGMYWDAMHKVVTAALTAASEGGEMSKRECDYWKPIPEGGVALPCNCGNYCDDLTDDEEAWLASVFADALIPPSDDTDRPTTPTRGSDE